MTARPTDPFENMDVFLYRDGSLRRTSVPVVREVLLEVLLDGRRVASIACGGDHLEELATGFLFSEGWIGGAGDIAAIERPGEAEPGRKWPGEIRTVAVRTRGGAAPPVPEEAGVAIASSGARGRGHWPAAVIRRKAVPSVTPGQAFRLVDQLVEACVLHEQTRGTHGAALAGPEGILVVREDIGRHNALDMLSGYILLNGTDVSDGIIVRTGRASLEIVVKTARMGIPVLLSLGAATTEAVRFADRAGITLAGRIQGGSMTVYTHESRIGTKT
jgi:FdhD protein